MIGKNNVKLLERRNFNQVNYYSIKKLKFGVASVFVGGLLFLGLSSTVEAAEHETTSLESDTISNDILELTSTPIRNSVEETNSEVTKDKKVKNIESEEKMSELYVIKVLPIIRSFNTKLNEEDIFHVIQVVDYPIETGQITYLLLPYSVLPDGKTPGNYIISVLVTYPDGSTKIAEVSVTIEENAVKQEAQSEEKISKEEVKSEDKATDVINTDKVIVPVTIDKKQSEQYNIGVSSKTPVSDLSSFTKEEQDAVKAKVADKAGKTLPTGTKLEVKPNGEVTVTYPDGTKDSLLGQFVVTPTTNTHSSQASLGKVVKELPKTGLQST